MKNSILLINFNHNRDCNNKEFLKQLYQPYFKSIFFYSDNPVIDDNEINFINTHRGFYTHRIFDHFFNKYSSALKNIDGIFYTHDDCVINTKIIDKLNVSKIFIGDSDICYREIEKNDTTWSHLKEPYGLPGIQKIIHNPVNIIRRGFSDFFYLPHKYFNQYLVNLFELYKNIFLELAIPSIINHIEPNQDNYQHLKTIILWFDKRKQILDENFLTNSINDEYAIIHPIKFNQYPILKQYLSKILL